MADGFLSRWSRRKSGRSDEVIKEDEELAKPSSELAPELEGTPVPLSLDDVEKIDALAPDFSAFMNPNVDPQVQQAALKKMFTDPHFNVMDRLDIYIDDYSQPDPLPIGMLERLAQSEMLNLFRKKDGGAEESINQAHSKHVTKEPDETAIEASSQTDLTSPQSPSSAKIADLDAVPLASDKKKT
jgi:hypothetical protein